MASEDDGISKDTFIRGRDIFERMNYLYQLSHFWSNLSPELAAHYAKLMSSISKKAVLRVDSSVKRTLCKGCSFYLVEGKTLSTKFKKEHGGQIINTCLKCKTRKRFSAPKKPKQ